VLQAQVGVFAFKKLLKTQISGYCASNEDNNSEVKC